MFLRTDRFHRSKACFFWKRSDWVSVSFRRRGGFSFCYVFVFVCEPVLYIPTLFSLLELNGYWGQTDTDTGTKNFTNRVRPRLFFATTFLTDGLIQLRKKNPLYTLNVRFFECLSRWGESSRLQNHFMILAIFNFHCNSVLFHVSSFFSEQLWKLEVRRILWLRLWAVICFFNMILNIDSAWLETQVVNDRCFWW